MRRAYLAVLIWVCALSPSVFGLDVNKSELESVADQRIEFLNYQGPPQKVIHRYADDASQKSDQDCQHKLQSFIETMRKCRPSSG